MLTTTEFRTHWTDSAGRHYKQRRPFTAAQLRPVLNLDEVRAWLDLSTSSAMLRLGYPGGPDDARIYYTRLFLADDLHEAERERLAPFIAEELTDDIPLYHQSPDADWRTPFVTMREQRPLPVLGGPAEIRNLTPHAVTVREVTLAPSGVVARATEEATEADPIRLLVQDDHPGLVVRDIPTSTMRYTGLVDLPAPEPGIYLIVSMVIPPVAFARGRWTGDLLVPGEQVRDAAGRIIGCRSLARTVR